MDKKKEFDKQFSLLCDVFKFIDPSFIDTLKRVTARSKKEEQKPVKENNDCDGIQVPMENTDWNDAETACADDICDNENTYTKDKDDTNFNEFDEPNAGYLGFYLSKISLSVDDNDCATLNVLYVVNPDNFDKFTYEWMGDAFENACINNINKNKIYGHIINRIHFAFYLIDDYNAGKTKEENNILLKPDWVWDPDMLTFYADTKDNDNMEYVRVVIEDKEDPYIHMLKAHVVHDNDSLKIDNITKKQRDEFVLLLNDRVVKQEDDNDSLVDHLLTAKDIATSAKLVNKTDCAVSVACENAGHIDMDKCMKCPEKDNCRPKIEDYINMSRAHMVNTHQFKFGNEKDVKSITRGIYSLAAYADSPGNKEITNYWKGCIEKDIYLDSQNRIWGVDEFLDFMNDAVRYAIQDKNYTYSSDEDSTTVCFNYMDISKLYYDSTDKPELTDMLGMTHFDSDAKERPSAQVLEEYKHELARFLCDRFNFNNVSILKDDKHNDFLIICDY